MAIDKILMGSKLKLCRENLQRTIMEIDGLTELVTRMCKTDNGSELTIHNYKHCGDGVYELNGSSHGRLYTLRGDVENPDAVVY